ncbi:MAG TPA: hypothetical protein DHW01_02985, partial [Rhodobacter sp.]|nr:hypothetical protein [Rhodobacter sp.]
PPREMPRSQKYKGHSLVNLVKTKTAQKRVWIITTQTKTCSQLYLLKIIEISQKNAYILTLLI